MSFSQEPGPAKVASTGSGIPEAEKVPDSSSIIWQEELQSREAEVSQAWSSTDMTPQGSLLTPAGTGDFLIYRHPYFTSSHLSYTSYLDLCTVCISVS